MDLLIVGSGFFGLTIAERAAASGRKVTVIDRRHHIGGNAYSEDEPETGIEVHRYGAHLFHTSNPTRVGVRQPLHDVHRLRRTASTRTTRASSSRCRSTSARSTSSSRRPTRPTRRSALVHELAGEFDAKDAANLEEKGIALIGRPLYEAFIRDYTAKQWQTDPKELPAEVISRLPVRYTYDNRYFNDTWEGLPDRRLHRVDRADGGPPEHRGQARRPTSSTSRSRSTRRRRSASCRSSTPGPVDRYFDYAEGALSWRTIDLEQEVLPVGDFQGTTRHELRGRRRAVHAHPRVPPLPPRARRPLPDRQDRHHARVLALRRARRRAVLPGQHARRTASGLLAYRELAKGEKDVLFGGRLGTYQYLDMHMAIGSALSMWNNQLA